MYVLSYYFVIWNTERVAKTNWIAGTYSDYPYSKYKN